MGWYRSIVPYERWDSKTELQRKCSNIILLHNVQHHSTSTVVPGATGSILLTTGLYLQYWPTLHWSIQYRHINDGTTTVILRVPLYRYRTRYLSYKVRQSGKKRFNSAFYFGTIGFVALLRGRNLWKKNVWQWWPRNESTTIVHNFLMLLSRRLHWQTSIQLAYHNPTVITSNLKRIAETAPKEEATSPTTNPAASQYKVKSVSIIRRWHAQLFSLLLATSTTTLQCSFWLSLRRPGLF